MTLLEKTSGLTKVNLHPAAEQEHLLSTTVFLFCWIVTEWIVKCYYYIILIASLLLCTFGFFF